MRLLSTSAHLLRFARQTKTAKEEANRFVEHKVGEVHQPHVLMQNFEGKATLILGLATEVLANLSFVEHILVL